MRPALVTLVLLAISISGCSCSGEIGSDDAGVTVLPDGRVLAPDAAPSDAGPGTDGPASDTPGILPDGGCAPVMCQTHLYQCGNCLDDDGDGLADAMDPDCLGACHNDESSFDLGIPGGDSRPCALDCYYDQDQGSGNDGCEWDHRCDPLGPDPDPACAPADPPPPSASCPDTQASECHDFCAPLTPNGCDCFGCCELPAGSGSYVFIGSVDGSGTPTCELGAETDPALCHPCTPVGDCLNDCGRCELCLGRTTLPPDCFPPDGGTYPDGGTPMRCDPGIQACGLPGDPECPAGLFCLTGCCIFFG